MDTKELISIGRIVGTHGYKGTIKVESLTDFPQRFNDLTKIKLSHGKKNEELTVESCGQYKGLILMKLQGIESKEEAQLYRNALICINEEEIYPLPEGYYYHFQLVGLAVYDMEKGYLGVLKEVLETGANDVYVVKSESYGEILIPAIKQVVMGIDLTAKTMQVKLLEGLMD